MDHHLLHRDFRSDETIKKKENSDAGENRRPPIPGSNLVGFGFLLTLLVWVLLKLLFVSMLTLTLTLTLTLMLVTVVMVLLLLVVVVTDETGRENRRAC